MLGPGEPAAMARTPAKTTNEATCMCFPGAITGTLPRPARFGIFAPRLRYINDSAAA